MRTEATLKIMRESDSGEQKKLITIEDENGAFACEPFGVKWNVCIVINEAPLNEAITIVCVSKCLKVRSS